MSAQKNICALYVSTTLLACCLCCSCSKDYELQRQHAEPAGDSIHGGTTIIYDTAWIKIEGEIDLGEGEISSNKISP